MSIDPAELSIFLPSQPLPSGSLIQHDQYVLVKRNIFKNIFPTSESEALSSIPNRDSHARDKTIKHHSLFFHTELKIYYLSYSVYSYDSFDIADPSSMQGTCHRSIWWWPNSPLSSFDPVIELWNTEFEGLMFDTLRRHVEMTSLSISQVVNNS